MFSSRRVVGVKETKLVSVKHKVQIWNVGSAPKPLLWVLLITGVLGLLLGAVAFVSQVAVEQGQVLSGLVRYPSNSPAYIYNAKLWNVWGQLASLALSLGLSDFLVSLFLCALSGLLITWGFALWLFALTKNAILSLLRSFFGLILVYALRIDINGYSYPVMMMGVEHTYGMFVLSFMFFTLGFLALRWTILAFF